MCIKFIFKIGKKYLINKETLLMIQLNKQREVSWNWKKANNKLDKKTRDVIERTTNLGR